MHPRLSVLTALMMLVAAAVAGPAEAAGSGPTTASRIQMAPFMAPVRRTDGRIGTVAVTPLLRLADRRSFDTVCKLTPLIVDTFIVTLSREPLPPFGKGKRAAAAVGRRLTAAANGALGRPLVAGVVLVAGVPLGEPGDDRFAGTAPCTKKNRQEARKNG